MIINLELNVFLFLFLSDMWLTMAASVDLPLKHVQCFDYNKGYCDEDPTKCSENLIACHSDEDIVRYCMTLWKQNTTGNVILMKGCWPNNEDIYNMCNHKECISRTDPEDTDPEDKTYFCCCSGDGCNQQFKSILQNVTIEPSK